jgi:hypothetical protein
MKRDVVEKFASHDLALGLHLQRIEEIEDKLGGELGESLEARLSLLEQYVADAGITRPAETSAGITRQNLAALEEWMSPVIWQTGLDPLAQHKVGTILDQLRTLVKRAAAGERVPRPGEPV